MEQKRSSKIFQSTSNSDNFEENVNECVRYIFCREGSKIPIKRAEIIKHLNTIYETPTSQINSIMVETNNRLKTIYGYKLVQVEVKSGIHYIVVLNEENNSLMPTIIDLNHRRILVAALTHIYMTGGPVKDDEMWKFLIEAGLMEENDQAGQKLLTSTFTKQLYLHYSKVGDGNLVRNVFEWGQRAIEEVPKMFLLNKMAQAFNKSPQHWCEQYKEATEVTAEEVP